VVKHGTSALRDMVRSLTAIRVGKLYKIKYCTWQQCCRENFGFTRQRAHQLLTAGRVSTTVNISTERQARAAAKARRDAAKPPTAGEVQHRLTRALTQRLAAVHLTTAQLGDPVVFACAHTSNMYRELHQHLAAVGRWCTAAHNALADQADRADPNPRQEE